MGKLTIEGDSPVNGQATKGIRWMPWRKTAMKGVASCDKPRGVVKRTLIRGCPNGKTRFCVNKIIL